MTKAITPLTVAGVAMRASSVLNRSMPPVPSSTPISTLTPHTITITAHGTCAQHRRVVARAHQHEQRRPRRTPRDPRFTFRNTTATTQTAPTTSVIQ